MTKKLTAEEKIAKTLEYCEKAIDKAIHCQHTVRFRIELENTEWKTETGVYQAGSKYSRDFINVGMLYYALKITIEEAQLRSKFFDNLFMVRVWIKTFFGGRLIDEEVLSDYEITFRGGVEV